MSLKEELSGVLKTALKNGNEFEVGVFRLLLSAIHNKEIEKRGLLGKDEPLNDEEIAKVLKAEAKKRGEAAALFEKGGRPDLALREKNELRIIEKYLPAGPSEEEILKVIEETIGGVKGEKNFGAAMKAVMAKLRGGADGRKVSGLLKKKLGNGD